VSKLLPVFTLVVAVYALIGVVRSLTSVNDNPVPWLSLAAWGLWSAAFVALTLPRVTGAERLSRGSFIAVCAALVAVVCLDLWAVTVRGDGARDATAALSAAALVLVIATLRPARDAVVSTLVLGGAFGATFIVTGGRSALTAQGIPELLVTLTLVIAPGLVGVWLVSGITRIVRREDDRALALLAAAESGPSSDAILARLDREAETLLDAVALGATPLPLSSAVAAEASSLATELRFHLLAARSGTIN
jgi:hypothetical protein